MGSTHYKQSCGCEANIHLDTNGMESGSITYCPKHAAAPDMFEALDWIIKDSEHLGYFEQFGEWHGKAVAALEVAKGKGNSDD